MKAEAKLKSFIPQIFGTKQKKTSKKNEDLFDSYVDIGDTPTLADKPVFMKLLSESDSQIGNLSFSDFSGTPKGEDTQGFRIFVATWNVGGKTPHSGINLNDFFPTEEPADIYVLGFQEIVPLNAGNVLVLEDNQPAVRWLSLINKALNRQSELITAASCPTTPSNFNSCASPVSCTDNQASRPKSASGLLFFQKSSFKSMPEAYLKENNSSNDDEEKTTSFTTTDLSSSMPSTASQSKYSLVTRKQMVGIFVTVWAKKELVQHIGHLRLSCIGRGIMGYLGNKGCISVSMSLHQTTFCFVCSHLASGEKEGDELRRNSDVKNILKHTQFSRICKNPGRRIPEKILEHDRVIWLGDLNYRIALSYSETRKLLEHSDWNTLFEKDQLNIEREAGRVFEGWNEGKIFFAPTYKYSYNSDSYAGENGVSRKKRTPSWCDRILWHGDGIEQLSYIRGESRFSDHRPVCAVFTAEVGVLDSRLKKDLSASNMKVAVEELLPPHDC